LLSKGCHFDANAGLTGARSFRNCQPEKIMKKGPAWMQARASCGGGGPQ
jgi:hypothetical protein